MTGKQITAISIGLLAVIGLGAVVYKQLSVTTPKDAPTKQTETVSEKKKQADVQKKEAAKQVTPDTAVEDIVKEIESDNQLVTDEELGELSELETEGSSVSDFGTVYEESTN